MVALMIVGVMARSKGATSQSTAGAIWPIDDEFYIVVTELLHQVQPTPLHLLIPVGLKVHSLVGVVDRTHFHDVC
jgi:hypothetical protein